MPRTLMRTIAEGNEALKYAVGEGWHELLKPVVDYCNANNIQINTIEEKCGTLRIHIDCPKCGIKLNMQEKDYVSIPVGVSSSRGLSTTNATGDEP